MPTLRASSSTLYPPGPPGVVVASSMVTVASGSTR